MPIREVHLSKVADPAEHALVMCRKCEVASPFSVNSPTSGFCQCAAMGFQIACASFQKHNRQYRKESYPFDLVKVPAGVMFTKVPPSQVQRSGGAMVSFRCSADSMPGDTQMIALKFYIKLWLLRIGSNQGTEARQTTLSTLPHK